MPNGVDLSGNVRPQLPGAEHHIGGNRVKPPIQRGIGGDGADRRQGSQRPDQSSGRLREMQRRMDAGRVELGVHRVRPLPVQSAQLKPRGALVAAVQPRRAIDRQRNRLACPLAR